jgi:crotonobetainyl-CoA:carnitine CoA-transferase CaiB-like acyl-CoA transferase
MIRHPHIAALELLEEYDHPRAGRLRQARNAARFAGTPASIRRPAPVLGQHTDEVLTEIGYAASEIAELRAAGATG